MCFHRDLDDQVGILKSLQKCEIEWDSAGTPTHFVSIYIPSVVIIIIIITIIITTIILTIQAVKGVS